MLKTQKSDRHEESVERTSGNAIARLQRGVLKLAFSYYGQNPELDDCLRRLGSAIKNGRMDNDIQRLIDEIIEVIVAKEIGHAPTQAAGRLLADLLGRVSFKGPPADAARAIQRRALEHKNKDELDRLLLEAAAIFNTLAKVSSRGEMDTGEFSHGAQEPLRVLLSHLDLPVEAKATLDALRHRLDANRTQAMALTLAEEAALVISAALRPPQIRQISKSEDGGVALARDQLSDLVQQLPLPRNLFNDVGSLRQTIKKATTPGELKAGVHAIIGLISKGKSQLEGELNEINGFLKSVTRRLEELKDCMVRGGLVHSESLQSTADLNRLITGQVCEMRDKVHDEIDLNKIKRTVVDHLNLIDTGLSSFVVAEESRHTGARVQIDQMVRKLVNLETETQHLRHALAEQRTRSLIDPLTGVFNRIGYIEGANREFSRWSRYGGSLCIAVIDVDLFKNVNDEFGHAAGDKVLATVASLMSQQIRQCDVLCRYGGEEFVLILPETSLEGAMATAEKLRSVIEQSNFHFRDTPVPVTVSVGLAEFHPNDSIEAVFERADLAMYLAKRKGRNRCNTENDLSEERRTTA